MNRLQLKSKQRDSDEAPTRMVPAEQLSQLLRSGVQPTAHPEDTIATDSDFAALDALEDVASEVETTTADAGSLEVIETLSDEDLAHDDESEGPFRAAPPIYEPLEIERTVFEDDELTITGAFAAIAPPKSPPGIAARPLAPKVNPLADARREMPPSRFTSSPPARNWGDFETFDDEPADPDAIVGAEEPFSRTVVLTPEALGRPAVVNGSFHLPATRASSSAPPPAFPSYPSMAMPIAPSASPETSRQMVTVRRPPLRRAPESLLAVAVCGMFAVSALVLAIGMSPSGKSALDRIFGHTTTSQAAVR